MEVAVDECVSGKEVLGLIGRFEPLHLSLPPSGRLMCVLGTIIQVLALSMRGGRPKLSTWYSQTAWLMIPAGNRWR
jgi:hypothetical protein